jgi:hypothetical protein
MKTTMLIVEFLVGGILVSLALVFFVSSVFLGDIQEVRYILVQDQSEFVLLLLSTIFLAIAYAVGLFLETFARKIFEEMLDEIKRDSLAKYVKYLDEEYHVDFTKSPILKKFKDELQKKGKEDEVQGHWLIPFLKQIVWLIVPLKKKKKDRVREYGLMRFYVLMTSSQLYQDIASHLHRYRLMRISFIAEVILIIAIIVELYREITLPMLVAPGILIIVVYLNVLVIRDRFKRYCWAIEKSYRVLVFDQK